MFSVCGIKHLLERGVIVTHILEEPLLGELLLGQGLCEGHNISLHDELVLGLITCVGVGFVRRPHLLVGGVHSVTANPRGSRMAVGAAGDTQSRRVTLTSCMDEMSANTRT